MTATQPSRSVQGLVGLLGAHAASLSANRLLSIAVPWFVLTTTGSVAKTGVIAFCQVTPFVVAQALAGPVIDRIGPRRISIVGDLVAMAATVTAPLHRTTAAGGATSAIQRPTQLVCPTSGHGTRDHRLRDPDSDLAEG